MTRSVLPAFVLPASVLSVEARSVNTLRASAAALRKNLRDIGQSRSTSVGRGGNLVLLGERRL